MGGFKMVNITLQGQEYNAKLDFSVIGKIQVELSKIGLNLKLKEIFEEVEKENFAVVNEIVVQSILKCHPKLKRHAIEDKLTIGEMETVVSFLTELLEKSIAIKTEGK
jgi:hypothetical protein